jgi:hypothetical protein
MLLPSAGEERSTSKAGTRPPPFRLRSTCATTAFRTSARTVWPALVSAPILGVVVPHLTYVGLQQTEEGLLMLVIPFVVGPWSLGLLTGWAFGRPRS